MPNAGPSARIGNAQRHPHASTSTGTSWIVNIVSRNPREVCSVRAVPTACGGALSLTMALNCAESATTKKPQHHTSGTSSHGLAPNRKPITTQQAPEIAIATVTTLAYPQRSAIHPPQSEPTLPIASALKDRSWTREDGAEGSLIARLAARNVGSHAHIA